MNRKIITEKATTILLSNYSQPCQSERFFFFSYLEASTAKLMLPFFRKIRYRLARDNQFFKYSRYAIGEIVLVVIGILIALYINNWNEERKMKQTELILLKNLLKELNGDLKSFEGMKQWSEGASQSSIIIVNALKNKTPLNDSVLAAFTKASLPFDFNYNSATFENLKSIGFSIISNIELRGKIQNLYSRGYAYQEKGAELFNQEFMLNMNVQQAKHLDAINGNYPVNYEGLQDDFVFINTVGDHGRNHHYSAETLQYTIGLVRSLISDIESEIEKLE